MRALERPELPAVEAPLAWPALAVAVVGDGGSAFARRLAGGLPGARVVRVELRHAQGWTRHSGSDEVVVHTAPSSLLEAVTELRGDDIAPIVGVGAAFAAAVRTDLLVWIRAWQSAAALPPALRAIVSRAELVLDEPRPETADALARAVAAR